jgi:hypothetical protein
MCWDLKGGIVIRLWSNLFAHYFISMLMGEEWDNRGTQHINGMMLDFFITYFMSSMNHFFFVTSSTSLFLE